MESFTSLSENIKTYADAKARELSRDNPKVFVIVVTTQPRAWRISFAPTDFLGGEATRQIGDDMAAKFKKGEFYNGLANASTRLNALIPETSSPVERPAASSFYGAKRVNKETKSSESGGIELYPALLALGVGALFIIIIVFIVKYYKEQERIRQEEKKREMEESRRRWEIVEKKRREREVIERAQEAELEKKRQVERAKQIEAKKIEAKTTLEQDNSKAEALFNSFTPKQREILVNKHAYRFDYDHSAASDSSSFWMMMYMMNTHNNTPAQMPELQPKPEPAHRSSYSRSSDDDSYSRRSSSSDSYSSSSSSYDSGSSSSFDSSSSSDSSGSGGGW